MDSWLALSSQIPFSSVASLFIFFFFSVQTLFGSFILFLIYEARPFYSIYRLFAHKYSINEHCISGKQVRVHCFIQLISYQ